MTMIETELEFAASTLIQNLSNCDQLRRTIAEAHLLDNKQSEASCATILFFCSEMSILWAWRAAHLARKARPDLFEERMIIQ